MKNKDDTVKLLLEESRVNLDSSREKIAAVAMAIERGRITREARSISVFDNWMVGPIYSSDILTINLYVARKVDESPVKTVRNNRNSLYVGLTGKTLLTYARGYSAITPGMHVSVPAGTPHQLDPVAVDTEILQLLVSEGSEL
jgi:mannose-6-phosphate isomerase-like protein (cupin superfamily)